MHGPWEVAFALQHLYLGTIAGQSFQPSNATLYDALTALKHDDLLYPFTIGRFTTEQKAQVE